jgi:hypothetical protein
MYRLASEISGRSFTIELGGQTGSSCRHHGDPKIQGAYNQNPRGIRSTTPQHFGKRACFERVLILQLRWSITATSRSREGKGKWQSSVIFVPCGTRNRRHLVGREPFFSLTPSRHAAVYSRKNHAVVMAEPEPHAPFFQDIEKQRKTDSAFKSGCCGR